jgi:hypothetical protein
MLINGISFVYFPYRLNQYSDQTTDWTTEYRLTTATRIFFFATQPPMQWVSGALSLGVEWPDREAEHSPPSSAQVKNAWSYTSTSSYVFMA